MAIANTTVTVLGGTSTNAFGDTIPAGNVLLSGVPAFIGETNRKVQDPSSPTPRTIRQITGQVPRWAGVNNTRQLVDERTGDTYQVMSVTDPPSLFGTPGQWPQVLELKRVTASGP